MRDFFFESTKAVKQPGGRASLISGRFNEPPRTSGSCEWRIETELAVGLFRSEGNGKEPPDPGPDYRRKALELAAIVASENGAVAAAEVIDVAVSASIDRIKIRL